MRRNDTSAASINEWTGEKVAAGGAVSDGIAPIAIQAVGNYAVLIMWEDGFNQVHLPSNPKPQTLRTLRRTASLLQPYRLLGMRC